MMSVGAALRLRSSVRATVQALGSSSPSSAATAATSSAPSACPVYPTIEMMPPSCTAARLPRSAAAVVSGLVSTLCGQGGMLGLAARGGETKLWAWAHRFVCGARKVSQIEGNQAHAARRETIPTLQRRVRL